LFVSSHRRRITAVVLALLPFMAVAAFSGSPAVQTASAPPSGVANISGTWTGTSDWEQQAVHSFSGVTVSIDQNDRTVNGSLAFTSPAFRGWSGTISGTVAGTSPDTQFVGTIEVQAPPTAGRGSCTGRAIFFGRSMSNSLRWDTSQLNVVSSPDDQPASACRGLLRDVVLIMER
jgi:hypothetical protein